MDNGGGSGSGSSSNGGEDLFAELEKQFSGGTVCECARGCFGFGEGRWFLRFSCPGCAAKGVPTDQRATAPVLCCTSCAEWVMNSSMKTCSLCGWAGLGLGRVVAVAYLNAEGAMVVGDDIAQVVAIMDSTPEYEIGSEDQGAFEARQEEEEGEG